VTAADGVPGPVAALQTALAAEHAAVYGYGVAGSYLTGDSMTTATADWVAHQEARDTLQTMLLQRGAQPVPAAAAYQLPQRVTGPMTAAVLATALEDGVTTAYLGVVALSHRTLREFGARAVTAAATRAASWRGRTVAFPGFPASAQTAPSATPRPSPPPSSGH
jgi:Domain of unknown function (DUF4439)